MYAPTLILSLAALFAGATAAALPDAAPAPAPALEARKWRSNIDVQQACREQRNGAPALVTGSGCGGWSCIVDGNKLAVNMDKYCIDRFGVDAYASCYMTAYDWQCHDRS